jgi:hypothetical protein
MTNKDEKIIEVIRKDFYEKIKQEILYNETGLQFALYKFLEDKGYYVQAEVKFDKKTCDIAVYKKYENLKENENLKAVIEIKFFRKRGHDNYTKRGYKEDCKKLKKIKTQHNGAECIFFAVCQEDKIDYCKGKTGNDFQKLTDKPFGILLEDSDDFKNIIL